MTKAISVRRHLKTRKKDHLPTCVVKFFEKEPKIMTRATKSATKRSSVAKHLVNDKKCAKNYDLSGFKTLHQCLNIMDLIIMEAISIYLEKLVLCKQKEFDYKVSLFYFR